MTNAQDAVTREQIEAWAKLANIPLMFEHQFEKLGDFAIFARQDRAAAQADAAPSEPVAWEMDWPEYSYDGMGCGLEDRNITDRYDAMKYGWDEALERVGQVLERDGPLYAAPLPREAATVPPLTPEDVERQYEDGVHIGSGLPRATCPCGFCAKHRHGFNRGAAAPQAAATLKDERSAFVELRSQMAYIAAYCPDESDGMSKDRLVGRLRAIIERARRAVSDAPAAPQAAATVPLTDEKILEVWDGIQEPSGNLFILSFARALLAASGDKS
ncbi:hypothetical protein QF001_000870 [Paraburkholderia youngii]|uniref:hypothetical protein n=1 Tax=Paraburkholderia youngii TaxID=2782701 RepID=UPI003D1C6976